MMTLVNLSRGKGGETRGRFEPLEAPEQEFQSRFPSLSFFFFFLSAGLLITRPALIAGERQLWRGGEGETWELCGGKGTR